MSSQSFNAKRFKYNESRAEVYEVRANYQQESRFCFYFVSDYNSFMGKVYGNSSLVIKNISVFFLSNSFALQLSYEISHGICIFGPNTSRILGN